MIIYGVVSFQDWGVAPARTDSLGEFVARNAYVLLSLLLLAALPARPGRRSAGSPATP